MTRSINLREVFISASRNIALFNEVKKRLLLLTYKIYFKRLALSTS